MMRMKKFKWYRPLIFCILLFMIISTITIHSAMTYLPSYLGNLALKQLIWYVLGFIIVFILIQISNQTLYRYAWYIYITNLLLLFLLLIIGQPINGSKCWFTIPGIGSFQPSEFMKIALIIMNSVIMSHWMDAIPKYSNPNWKQEIILLFKVFLIFLVPTLLTFLEPDTGAVFIYFIIILSMLWTSPLRKRWFILGILLIGILLGTFLFLYFRKQDIFVEIFGTDLFYRIDRLLDWKNGTGMQLENSLTAIGSSGFLGHGYNRTPIYFPESGTDFIFAVFASNFGLIGSLLFLILVFYFDFLLITLAKNCKNTTDQYMIIGIFGMLLYQQVQNIGMTLGILPITGITLPFISYGGSSLLSYMMILGIVLNIYSSNHKTIN